MKCEEIIAQMEPCAAHLGDLDSLGETAQVSMAVSLKRIADALEQQNRLASALASGLYNVEIEE